MADIIRIDLATGAASAALLAGDLAGLGGRSLTSALVAAEVGGGARPGAAAPPVPERHLRRPGTVRAQEKRRDT